MNEKVTKTAKQPLKIKGFRIKAELEPKLEEVAKKADRTPSWIINKCLETALPILEKDLAA
jgi:predicted transcriptional regulator